MSEERWPEHAKLRALEGKNEVVGDFVEWLREQPDLTIGLWRPHFCTACMEPWKGRRQGANRCSHCGAAAYYESEDRLMPASISMPDLLARYFEIDQGKLETEKRQMLEELRVAPEWPS